MAKSHRKRNNIVKNITKSANKALPVVNKSLETVGNTAKGVAIKSAPFIEKGISAVYKSIETGLDLGVKGARKIAKDVSKYNKKSSKRRRSYKGNKSRKHRY